MRCVFGTAVIFALMGAGALISVHTNPNSSVEDNTSESESRQYSMNYPQNIRYPPLGFENQQQGLADILETVAAKDVLHCIPKMLCEMTSGMSYKKSSDKPSNSYINLDSLLTLLSGVDDRAASPVVQFGKAIVLGYTAKNSGSCKYAYPRCPNDPDRLIHYLNNHNGGLFRFFNGQPNWGTAANSFNIYESGDKRQYAWRFPSYDSQIHNYENDGWRYHEKGKSLKFPSSQEGYKHHREHEHNYQAEHNNVLVFHDFK